MMQLTLTTLKTITTGAARVEQTAAGFRFYRFTEQQESQYAAQHPDLLRKTYSTAGVCLECVTDSAQITLEVDFAPSTTRKYYAFDIFCDNRLVTSVTNMTDGAAMLGTDFPLDRMNETVVLPAGIKTLKVVFPWSVVPTVRAISVDDGALLQPVPAKPKMLFFGDSITHGYDASRPSESYVYRLAERLGVEVHNKAIGGEVFFPALAACADDFVPQYIVVAYGTNDWFKTSFDRFERNCLAFYKALTACYPGVPIFALTPIWRKDKDEQTLFGAFERVRETIFAVAAQLDAVHPIDGYDFVPHEGDVYFSDRMLHPNSAGFAHYADNAYNAIKKYI